MTLRDLSAVCDEFDAYMHNINTRTNIDLDLDKSHPYHKEIMDLKVKDIYADHYVMVEVKFDKHLWKALRRQ